MNASVRDAISFIDFAVRFLAVFIGITFLLGLVWFIDNASIKNFLEIILAVVLIASAFFGIKSVAKNKYKQIILVLIGIISLALYILYLHRSNIEIFELDIFQFGIFAIIIYIILKGFLFFGLLNKWGQTRIK